MALLDDLPTDCWDSIDLGHKDTQEALKNDESRSALIVSVTTGDTLARFVKGMLPVAEYIVWLVVCRKPNCEVETGTRVTVVEADTLDAQPTTRFETGV